MNNRDKFLNLLFWGNPHIWDDIFHWSDCAIYDELASPCDCGAVEAHKRFWTYLYHLFCIRHVRLQSVFLSRLGKLFGTPVLAANMVPYQNERCRQPENNGASRSLSGSNHTHGVPLHDSGLYM